MSESGVSGVSLADLGTNSGFNVQTDDTSQAAITNKKTRMERKCKKCGNLWKGHVFPRGNDCTLSPVNKVELEQQQNLRVMKHRENRKTDTAKAKDRARKATKEVKSEAKARNLTEESKSKAKARKSTEEAKAKDKIRQRTIKSQSMFKSAWSKPNTFVPVTRLKLPNMSEECVDCGARMFPWELSRKKGDGLTFSKCCGYGQIKLRPFKDPSPALQSLFAPREAALREFNSRNTNPDCSNSSSSS